MPYGSVRFSIRYQDARGNVVDCDLVVGSITAKPKTVIVSGLCQKTGEGKSLSVLKTLSVRNLVTGDFFESDIQHNLVDFAKQNAERTQMTTAEGVLG